ncbi:MAG: YlxR family protein [Gemmatimonadetes bacterium]|nr:YlxR family protein [Gemmatimonadota bacterium]
MRTATTSTTSRRWNPSSPPGGKRGPERSLLRARATARRTDVPIRTCVACRTRREKHDLLRWVVDARGVARPDVPARSPGRGYYVCRLESCFERLLKSGPKRGRDFRNHEPAFRLAVQGDVVQNGPGETHEN